MSGRVLLELPRGSRGKLIISRGTYNGRLTTRLTPWYPTEYGELRPSRSVTIRDSEVVQVVAVLRRVAEQVALADELEEHP